MRSRHSPPHVVTVFVAVRSIVSAVLVSLLAGTDSLGQTEAEKSLLRSVANQYESNRAGFAAAAFEFDFQAGRAENIDAVLDARFDKGRMRFTGIYAISGHTERYDRISDLQDTSHQRTPPGGRETSTAFFSFRYLWNERVSILDRLAPSQEPGVFKHSAQVYADPNEWTPSLVRVPLRLGRNPEDSSLSFWIHKALNSEDGVAVLEIGDEVVEETTLLRLGLTSPRAQLTFWVDLERGALPVKRQSRMSTELGGHTRTVVLHDVRNTPRGWVPFLAAWHLPGIHGYRLQVTRAVFDDPLIEKLFELEFPRAGTMIDIGRNRTFGKKEIWTLADVSGPGEAMPQPIQFVEPRGPTMPGERTPFNWAIPIVLFVTIGFALAAWQVRKMARRAV